VRAGDRDTRHTCEVAELVVVSPYGILYMVYSDQGSTIASAPLLSPTISSA